MNARSAQIHRTSHRLALAVAFTLAAGTLAGARAARAEFPLPSPHEIHRDVLDHVHESLRLLGRIPEQLERAHANHLEVFFGGNSYYAPHRHNHYVYNFPVWIDGSVYYRPYTYCNDHLYGTYSYRPQVWVDWGLASQGHYCNLHHGYYPNNHSCFSSHGYGRPVQHYSQHTYVTPNHHQDWRGSDRRYDPRREGTDARRSSGFDRRTDDRRQREPQRQGQKHRSPHDSQQPSHHHN